MLISAVAGKGIRAKTVLFDNWYSSWENLKLVNTLKLIFYTTLKNNRLVSLTKDTLWGIKDGYVHLDDIDWTPERLDHGVVVKLNTHKGH
jgi:hypothetical protein